MRATRRERRLGPEPNPVSSGCENCAVRAELTEGLKKFALEVLDCRLLFRLTRKLVPVANACVYAKFPTVAWLVSEVNVAELPVPERNPLFTGIEVRDHANVDVSSGSKLKNGPNGLTCPGPDLAFSTAASKLYVTYRCRVMSRLFCRAIATASSTPTCRLPSRISWSSVGALTSDCCGNRNGVYGLKI